MYQVVFEQNSIVKSFHRNEYAIHRHQNWIDGNEKDQDYINRFKSDDPISLEWGLANDETLVCRGRFA